MGQNIPSLKKLTGLLNSILLNARNAGHQDISLCGEHVLKAMPKLMEERHHVTAEELQGST